VLTKDWDLLEESLLEQRPVFSESEDGKQTGTSPESQNWKSSFNLGWSQSSNFLDGGILGTFNVLKC